MPNIQLKRSLTSGSLPTTASLAEGELAINVPDGRIFLRKSGSGTDTVESVITTGARNSGSIQLTGSMNVSGSVTATGNIIASGETASTIASFGTSKELKSLPTATYPSLTELTYVKGVTSNIQTQLNTKATFSGTTNYLLKYGTSTTQATSRVQDTGTYVGIGTINTPAKDLTFVGTKAIEIGLEDYSPILEGKDLKIAAGRAVNFAYGAFSKLNFGTGGANGYGGIHIAPSTNVAYIVQRYSNLQTSTYPYTSMVDTGIGMGSAESIYMTPQNNLYLTDYGSISKRTNNTGAFVSQATFANYYAKGITSTSNGDLYYCVTGGDIYKQTNQTGTPVALGQTSRSWSGLAADSSDNIYACVTGGDIYKRVGAGNFVAMGYTSQNYTCITITPIGDVYLGDSSGNVWKQTLGAGAPALFAAVGLNIKGIACDSYSNLYITIGSAVAGADVYFNLNSTTGTSDLQGGTLKLAAGTGKGAGASKIHFITGQVTGSGTTMQTETVRAVIDETGVMTLPSITNALIVSESTGKAIITKEYLSSVTGSITALSASYALTASYAMNGGGGAAFPYTGSAQITGSLGVTGSVNVTQGITGSLFGTSSWAVSSSFTTTASFITTAQTASFVTGSNVFGPFGTNSILSSSFAVSSSRAVSSSYALTASYALTSAGGGGAAFPYTGSALITGSLGVTGSISVTQNITGSRVFLSGSNSTASGSILTVYGSGSTQPVLTVQGSQGELFSITDSLSGSLFSVNDISGLPILEAFSDNTIVLGNYQAPALLTTAKSILTNSGSFTLYSIPTASYDTAFFEYSVRSGSNARAGQIMAIQSGSSVNYTETTSSAFGVTTGLALGVFVSGSNMVLTGSASTTAWTVKSIIKAI